MVEKATAAELPSGIGLHHVHVLAGAVHVVFLAYYLLDRTWVAAQFFIEAAVVGHRITIFVPINSEMKEMLISGLYGIGR